MRTSSTRQHRVRSSGLERPVTPERMGQTPSLAMPPPAGGHVWPMTCAAPPAPPTGRVSGHTSAGGARTPLAPARGPLAAGAATPPMAARSRHSPMAAEQPHLRERSRVTTRGLTAPVWTSSLQGMIRRCDLDAGGVRFGTGLLVVLVRLAPLVRRCPHVSRPLPCQRARPCRCCHCASAACACSQRARVHVGSTSFTPRKGSQRHPAWRSTCSARWTKRASWDRDTSGMAAGVRVRGGGPSRCSRSSRRA